MHSNSRYDNPYFIEKLVSALSYITSGFIGFIWLLLGIFTKSKVRPFMKYHIFQSIFLAIAYFLLCQLLGMLASIVSYIPFVNNIVIMITYFLNAPILFGFASIFDILIYTLMFYLVVTSMQGRYSYLPWISDIIKMNVRN